MKQLNRYSDTVMFSEILCSNVCKFYFICTLYFRKVKVIKLQQHTDYRQVKGREEEGIRPIAPPPPPLPLGCVCGGGGRYVFICLLFTACFKDNPGQNKHRSKFFILFQYFHSMHEHTGDFMKNVPPATLALRDRYKVLLE